MESSRFWLALLAATPACSFTPGVTGEDGDGGVRIDGQLADAPTDATCFGRGLATVCYAKGDEPTGTYAPVSGLDTGDDASCDRIVTQATGPALCVKSAATINLADDVRFTGARPLVLIATEAITVSAALDVEAGAGANTGTCVGPDDGVDDTSSASAAGASGAGGGGFGTMGGAGGNGASVGGGAGGQRQAVTSVRGGCRGGRGGQSSAGTGGAGGAGGGAVYLIAGTSITVTGLINASGGGGNGGPNKAGGGGGGSGGLIGLDAPLVDVSGVLFANGGGGGEGGGGGDPGGDGEDPSAWNQIPDGGGGNGDGGNGGDGAYLAVAAKGGGNIGNGGGGGGGGVGHILVFAASSELPSTISPAAVVTTLP